MDYKISKTLIDSIIDRIVAELHPVKIVVFGSASAGNTDDANDLDLLIVNKTKLPSYERQMAVRKLFKGMPCPMDIIVYTPEEFDKWRAVPQSFLSSILRTGTVVYG